MVVCRTDGAVIERVDAPFAAECAKYYVELEQVADLLEHCRDVLKLAIFDFGEAAVSAQRYFSGLDQQVVVSGKHWIDIMDRDANKGHGVRCALQEALGVTAARTVAFGDYPTTSRCLAPQTIQYAVANAHPDVAAVAARRIPSNAEEGVVLELERLLRSRWLAASVRPGRCVRGLGRGR